MSVNDRVRDLVEPIVEDFDLYLFDLDFVGGRLRVTVDTREASQAGEGVTSGIIARVTRHISRELDEEDPISSGYTLEVTTPGVERRLHRPDHFSRSIGEKVSVKMNPNAEINGERRVNGVLASADTDGFVVTADSGDAISIAYGDVAKARTVFDWGPSPKPGSTKAKSKSKSSGKSENLPPTKTDSSQDKAGAQ